MSEPMAAADDCEHHYQSRLLGGHPLIMRACYFCREPDWEDLREQADELYLWGWEEGRAGKPARERLSAYDRPRDGAEQPARTTANNPAASVDAANNPLREQYAAIIRSECGSRFGYVTELLLAVHERDTAQLRRERDMALAAASEARRVVDQVRAALTGEFMAGPNAAMVVCVDTVREALKAKEAR